MTLVPIGTNLYHVGAREAEVDKKPQLKANVDQMVKDQLLAISRASPDGLVDESAQLRKAVEEYIEKRIAAPAVQRELAAIRGQPLKLVPVPQAEAES